MRLLFYAFTAAAAAHGPIRGRFTDQLGAPDGRDELLHAMVVELDRGAIRVRICDRTKAILTVANGLTFRQDLHSALPWMDKTAAPLARCLKCEEAL
jgi:hypothetical protein